ncbi:hypothetical protein [Ornithinibacillus gellani]|nr:hypothetical protein [Ornithinibacillus gellani]
MYLSFLFGDGLADDFVGVHNHLLKPFPNGMLLNEDVEQLFGF